MSGMLQGLHTGEHLIDLEPPRATLEQLNMALSNRLELIPVEKDVLGVVEHLKRIDAGLHLTADVNQGIYVLWWKGWRVKDNGRGEGLELCEDLVGAYTELDQRLIALIERIDAQGRGRADLADELEKLEAEKEAERERLNAEELGDAGERLRHALRFDLGAEGSQVYLNGSRGGRKGRNEQARRKRRATRDARKRSR